MVRGGETGIRTNSGFVCPFLERCAVLRSTLSYETGGRRRLWRHSLRRMMRPADPASRARARTRSKFAFRVGWTRLGQPEQFLIMRPTPTLSLSQAGPREEIRHPRDGQRCCGDPSFLQFKRCSFPSSSSGCIIIVTHSIHPSQSLSLLLFLCLRKMYTFVYV